MRPLTIVAPLEEVQFLLLRREVRTRRLGRLSLHVFVHALVLTILLGTRGANSLMHDAELHPPDVELAESMDSC